MSIAIASGSSDLPHLGRVGVRLYHRRSGARSRRAVEDERLLARIRELDAAEYPPYASRRLGKALCSAGEPVGRGRVERLMRAHGLVFPAVLPGLGDHRVAVA